MKVCPLTRLSSPAPEMFSLPWMSSTLLHGKSIPVPPWPNRTDGHFSRQHTLGILGVYDRSGV